MAVNKNFVVKNGIEVATDLIYAASDLDKVGIGSTIPTSTLEVGGDSKVTGNSTVVGIATVRDNLEVGVGGTVITADVQAGRIGLNTATPEHNVHISNVGSGSTTLFVDGGDVKINSDLIVTDTTFSTNLSVTGISTLGVEGVAGDLVDINSDVDMDANLHLTGVSTFIGDIAQTGNINVTGVGTISSDLNVGGNLTVTGDVSYDEVTGRNINITGVSTFNGVKIGDPAGIVTADGTSAGIVTYFGDGSNLTGIAPGLTAAIGIKSEGTVIGAGITQLDFASTNGTAIAVDVPPVTAAGVATVTFTPGVSIGLVIALGG